jgi:DNA-binding SARP family transcriptional activator
LLDIYFDKQPTPRLSDQLSINTKSVAGSTQRLERQQDAQSVLERVETAAMRIQLTGRVSVESAQTIVDERLLYGRQARLVFALLVVERDRPVHRDELAEALWPHGLPRTWDAALRGVISKVRAFLAAAGLPANATLSGGFGAYQLHLPPDVVVDVEFACLAVETAGRILREGNPEQATALAEKARAVAARPFFPEVEGQWVDRVRDHLREVLLGALCVLSEGYAHLGRHQLAVHTAEQAITLSPFRERTYQLLMQAHAATGNPAEALRAYDRCRRLLAEELGVEPAAETTALYTGVGDGQVGLGVVVEIAYRHRDGSVPGGEVGGLAEAAPAVTEQYRHVARECVGDGQVGSGVAIDITHRHRSRALAGGEIGGLTETAVAVTDEHRHVVGEDVGGGQIGLGVAVEVTHRDRGRVAPDAEVGGGAKAARTVARQHRHVVRVRVSDG